MDEDSYEKDVLFYVQLGPPKMLGGEMSSHTSQTTITPWERGSYPEICTQVLILLFTIENEVVYCTVNSLGQFI